MLVSTYSETGSLSKSLLLAQSDFPGLEEQLGNMLVMSDSLSSHPMLVPTLLSSLVINFAGESLALCDKEIADLEVQTGQEYKEKPVNPLALDFTDVTRTLNTIGRALGKSKRSIKAVQFQLNKYRNCIDSIKQKSPELNVHEQSDRLYEQIENLQSRCEGLLLHLEFNATRVQSLLSAVSPVINR